jgi:hypothetical protein
MFFRALTFALSVILTSVWAPAQVLSILWSKQDADPYTHVAFAHDGSFLHSGGLTVTLQIS